MASKTKGRTGSPLKKQGGNSNINYSSTQIHHDDYSVLDRDLFRGLTEREVENEHLKTTIVALSEQVAVSIINVVSN